MSARARTSANTFVEITIIVATSVAMCSIPGCSARATVNEQASLAEATTITIIQSNLAQIHRNIEAIDDVWSDPNKLVGDPRRLRQMMMIANKTLRDFEETVSAMSDVERNSIGADVKAAPATGAQ